MRQDKKRGKEDKDEEERMGEGEWEAKKKKRGGGKGRKGWRSKWPYLAPSLTLAISIISLPPDLLHNYQCSQEIINMPAEDISVVSSPSLSC